MKRVKIVAAATPEAEALLETIRKQVPGCEKIVANGRTHWVINNIAQSKSLLLYAEGDSVGYQMSLGVFPGRRTVMVDGLIWPDGQHGTRTGGVARAVKTLQGFAHELASVPARTHAAVTTASGITTSKLDDWKHVTRKGSEVYTWDARSYTYEIKQHGDTWQAARLSTDPVGLGKSETITTTKLLGPSGWVTNPEKAFVFHSPEEALQRVRREMHAIGNTTVLAAEPLSDRVSGQIIGDLKRIRSTVRSWKGKMDPAEYRDFVDYETQVGNFIAKTFEPRMSKASKAKLKGMK